LLDKVLVSDIIVTKIEKFIFFIFISTVFHKPTGLKTDACMILNGTATRVIFELISIFEETNLRKRKEDFLPE